MGKLDFGELVQLSEDIAKSIPDLAKISGDVLAVARGQKTLADVIPDAEKVKADIDKFIADLKEAEED